VFCTLVAALRHSACSRAATNIWDTSGSRPLVSYVTVRNLETGSKFPFRTRWNRCAVPRFPMRQAAHESASTLNMTAAGGAPRTLPCIRPGWLRRAGWSVPNEKFP